MSRHLLQDLLSFLVRLSFFRGTTQHHIQNFSRCTYIIPYWENKKGSGYRWRARKAKQKGRTGTWV